MKKIVFSVGLLALSALITNAQINQGGFPLSSLNSAVDYYAPISEYPLPEWDNYLAEYDNKEGNERHLNPYLVARNIDVSISFPQSGVFYEAEDGSVIWKAQVKVADAKALGFYYDIFNLPKGVNYFISNENGRHVLGAYTSNNNAESGMFANEAVQGGIVNLELNIPPFVNQNEIKLHINQVAVYFRAVEYLETYKSKDGIDFIYDNALLGGSSKCQLNAACPQGTNYQIQRRATLQQLIVSGGGLGMCSGSMVNMVGNSPGNCKTYYLTAAHCESSNSTSQSNPNINQIILRYNYETSSCVSLAVPTAKTINGAKFVSRSNISGNAGTIVGDFLLLEVTQNIPESWNVTLVGWDNRNTTPQTYTAPKKFIGFHHPSGDVKKLSTSQKISSDGVAQNHTHWSQEIDEGYIERGSSGSGLFNGDGRLIGIASVAFFNVSDQECLKNGKNEANSAEPSNDVSYAKFSTSWNYMTDGSADNRKLKPWLDPENTGATVIQSVTSSCNSVDGVGGTRINNYNQDLENSILIQPNPVVNNKLNIQFNLKEFTDISVTMYDITGKEVKSGYINEISTGTFSLDVSHLTSGMYMVKISDGNGFANKKVMIRN